MIVHVTDKTIDSLWPLMASGLGRALSKTSLGDYWGLDEAFDRVKQGVLFGFYQPESGYSGLYSINNTPKATVLYFFWSGKDESNQTPINFKELDEYLGVVAKAFNCKYINCEGRKGWKSVLAPLGYREDSLFYSREVTE